MFKHVCLNICLKIYKCVDLSYYNMSNFTDLMLWIAVARHNFKGVNCLYCSAFKG